MVAPSINKEKKSTFAQNVSFYNEMCLSKNEDRMEAMVEGDRKNASNRMVETPRPKMQVPYVCDYIAKKISILFIHWKKKFYTKSEKQITFFNT